MKIHEYQAKILLNNYQIPVVQGKTAQTPEEALKIAQSPSHGSWVVKAQIHAGGRGKAGGVRIVHSPEEVKNVAHQILGKRLVTYQTGPEGILVKKVLVEESCSIDHEYYMGLTLDREREVPVFLVSTEGGIEIEEVARHHPKKILKIWIHPLQGLQAFQARQMALFLGFKDKAFLEAVKTFLGLSHLFFDKDCSLVEINPFVKTKEGGLLALDAKINFDDNALFRHPEIKALQDPSQENALEVKATEQGLNYIGLDGNIGCMVNGAGLAMATMDIIKFYGGSPANFLDVGGGASAEMVTTAFKILLSHPKVKGILVNIFGGIMKCDVIATGIVEAARGTKINIPLVVRLEGTNVELGKKILNDSGLAIATASTMAEAAQEIVKSVNRTFLTSKSKMTN
ncbi:MAG: ADP-forming succinate--CoA ligase subunit beta [Chlamydiae bacterium]|nr:ADP-forming succinate--CoA ligase subunit beta [Chlamydiota bacterium]MBI3277008.1 ADP-forming succinate--CoA ligase subunit beta [Chlamydiota bacterium]